MTHENTTNTTPAATITEKELFAEFLEMELPASKNLFGESVRTYKPDDWLRDIGYNNSLDPFADAFADEIATFENPEEDLEAFIADVKQWVRLASEVLDDFRMIKAVRMPDEDEPDLTREADFIAMKPADAAVIRGAA